MKKKLSAYVLFFGTLLTSQNVLSEEVVEAFASGSINWSSGIVSATGYGVAPDNVANAKKRLLARRAAQLDAYRNLAEMINGVRVTSETVVKQMVAESDIVKTSLESMIKGAAITSDHYQNDVATVTVSMSLDGRFMESVAPVIDPKEFVSNGPVSTTESDVLSEEMIEEVLAFLTQFSPITQAYASDQTETVTIEDNEQLKVVKKVIELLQSESKDKVVATLQERIAFFENTNNFTGVLIDASKINDFEIATIPRVRDPKGNIIYPTLKALQEGSFSDRPVSYDFDVDDAVRNKRVAVKPYIIKAESVYKSRKSDLVVDQNSAELLKSHQALLSALGRAGVMIVVAK